MEVEDRRKLFVQIAGGIDKTVGAGGHIQRQRLYRRIGRPKTLHNAGISGEKGKGFDRSPDVQMVRVALGGHVGIRCENDIRPKVPDHTGDLAAQVLGGIEAAVTEIEKAKVLHAEKGGRVAGLPAPELGKLLRLQIHIQLVRAVAPVGADQKADLLPLRRQAGGCGAGADLDIVRVRADEEIAGKAFDFRKRGGKTENRSYQHGKPPIRGIGIGKYRDGRGISRLCIFCVMGMLRERWSW